MKHDEDTYDFVADLYRDLDKADTVDSVDARPSPAPDDDELMALSHSLQLFREDSARLPEPDDALSQAILRQEKMFRDQADHAAPGGWQKLFASLMHPAFGVATLVVVLGSAGLYKLLVAPRLHQAAQENATAPLAKQAAGLGATTRFSTRSTSSADQVADSQADDECAQHIKNKTRRDENLADKKTVAQLRVGHAADRDALGAKAVQQKSLQDTLGAGLARSKDTAAEKARPVAGWLNSEKKQRAAQPTAAKTHSLGQGAASGAVTSGQVASGEAAPSAKNNAQGWAGFAPPQAAPATAEDSEEIAPAPASPASTGAMLAPTQDSAEEEASPVLAAASAQKERARPGRRAKRKAQAGAAPAAEPLPGLRSRAGGAGKGGGGAASSAGGYGRGALDAMNREQMQRQVLDQWSAAMHAYDAQRYSEALGLFGRVEHMQPRGGRLADQARVMRARSLFKLKRYREASELFAWALRAKVKLDNRAEIRASLVKCYERTGQMRKARLLRQGEQTPQQ